MASIKLYLDNRAKKENAPIKFTITHRTKSAYIPTGIKIDTDQWDAHAEKVICRPDKNTLNAILRTKRLQVDKALTVIAQKVRISQLSHIQLRDRIQAYLEGDAVSGGASFASYFLDYAEKAKAANTRAIYMQTYRRMKAFCPELDELTFEEITKGWVEDFERFLAITSPSQNARNIHLRNIRAVFNDAADNDVTEAYPFKKIHIRATPTRHRALTIEQLRRLWNAEPDTPGHLRYLDAFRLSFLLRGINLVDLCALTKIEDDGRIYYHRAKTGGLLSVKVEPEAFEIINRHRGSNLLLNFAEDIQFTSFSHQTDKHLKGIIAEAPFNEITYYWARHTWATIAAGLDIPRETIAHGLGHRSEYNSVTDVYIKFDERKVDQANRAIIDYLLKE